MGWNFISNPPAPFNVGLADGSENIPLVGKASGFPVGPFFPSIKSIPTTLFTFHLRSVLLSFVVIELKSGIQFLTDLNRVTKLLLVGWLARKCAFQLTGEKILIRFPRHKQPI